MKKLYALFVVATIVVGVFMTLKFGHRPPPVGIMKPSFFSDAEEIGAVIYRRFYVPIEQKKLVVFGVPPQPQWHQDIVRGFIKAAAAEKRPFEVLLMEPDMPALDLNGLPPIEVKQVQMNTEMMAEFGDAVRAARSSGRRTLVFTASVFSTHLLKGNPITRFEHLTGDKLFTITSAPLVLRPDQEFMVDPPCVGAERDANGTADLGCAILMAGRLLYRKDLAQDRFVSIMQQNQENGAADDYLLMTSYPGQDKDATEDDNRAYRMKAPGVMGARGLPTGTSADTLPPAPKN